LFYALTAQGYAPFELPAIGACVELQTPSFLGFVLGQSDAVSEWFSPASTGDLCELR
jgi:hypothetical protein